MKNLEQVSAVTRELLTHIEKFTGSLNQLLELYGTFGASFSKNFSLKIKADEERELTLVMNMDIEVGTHRIMRVTNAYLANSTFPKSFTTETNLWLTKICAGAEAACLYLHIIMLVCTQITHRIISPSASSLSSSYISTEPEQKEEEPNFLNLSKYTVPITNLRVPSITSQVNIDADLIFNLYRYKSVDGLALRYNVNPDLQYDEKRQTFRNLGLYNRVMSSSCTVRNHGYIFGGITRGVFTNDLFRVSNSEIVRINTNLPELAFSSMCSYEEASRTKDYVVVSGGISTKLDFHTYTAAPVWSSQMYLLQVGSTEATQIAACAMPVTLCGHAIAMTDTHILVFGGMDFKGQFSNKVYQFSYDISQKSIRFEEVGVTGTVPSPRAGAKMCIVNNKLVIVGGHNEKEIVKDQIYMLDIGKMHFERVFVMGPSPRVTHPSSLTYCGVSKNTLLLCGGYNDQKGWQGNVYEYDLEKKRWKIPLLDPNSELGRAARRPFSQTIVCQSDIIFATGLESEKSLLRGLFFQDYSRLCEEAVAATTDKGSRLSDDRQSLAALTFGHGFQINNTMHDTYVKTLRKWFYSQDPTTSDVVFTFADEGYKKIFCHRDIIASQSRYFANLIADKEDEDLTEIMVYKGQKPEESQDEEDNSIKLYGIPYKHLGNFLEYIYTRSFFIHSHWDDSDIKQIYNIAKLFEEESLQSICTGTLDFEMSARKNISNTLSEMANKLLVPTEFSNKADQDPFVIPETENEVAQIEDGFEAFEITTPIGTPSTPFGSKSKKSKHHDSRSVVQFLLIKNFNRYMKKIQDFEKGLTSPAVPEYISIKVHKGLISQRVGYFQAMFSSKFIESRQSEVIIDTCSVDTFICFLQYVYTGVVPLINANQAIELYMLAHQYTIHELLPWIREIIRENISVGVACDVLDIADRMNDSSMAQYCTHYVAKNYNLIIQAEQQLAQQKKQRPEAKPAKQALNPTPSESSTTSSSKHESDFDFEAAIQEYEQTHPEQDTTVLSEDQLLVYSFNFLHQKLKAEILAAYVRHYEKK